MNVGARIEPKLEDKKSGQKYKECNVSQTEALNSEGEPPKM
jgi:hypothetical protein